MPEVCILGCGPSGLLAALAVEQAGIIPHIISPKKKSVIRGAQYLHKAIPDLTSPDPDGHVKFLKLGSEQVYAHKIYGNALANTSWSQFQHGEVRPLWYLRETYDWLWDHFEGAIEDYEVTPDEIDGDLLVQFEYVLSTAPLKAICRNKDEHEFLAARVWIDRDDTRYEADKESNVIIYNGERNCRWYRHSIIRDNSSYEYGHHVMGAVQGIKPLMTTCDCHPGMHRLGRFGLWSKAQLVHHAYDDAKRIMTEGKLGAV
jgi:hypothetical protein